MHVGAYSHTGTPFAWFPCTFLQGIFDDENIEDADDDVDAVLAQKRQQGTKRQKTAVVAERGGAGDGQPPRALAQQQQQQQGPAAEAEEEAEEEEVEEAEEEAESGSDAEAEPGTAAAKKRQRGAGGGGGGAAGAYGLSADALAGPEDGFEVVPAAESGESESEDEYEMLDDHTKVRLVHQF